MNKREKEVYEGLLDREDQVLLDLKKQYERALRDIDAKIRMLQSDDLTQSRIYQINYQKALKGQVEAILDKLHGDEYSTIQNYLSDSYTDAYVGTMYAMSGSGVHIIQPIDRNAAVKAVITDSELSVPLYASLGYDMDKMKKHIREEITRGIATSLPYDQIANNISGYLSLPLSNAKRIVRTEGHRIQQESADDARNVAKSKGADVVKQWDASLDGKTRKLHRELDGKICEVGEPFIEVGTRKVMYPGDFGDAAQDCNCRCVALTRARWALDEKELETLKKRAQFYKLDKTKSFEDFKEKYLGVNKKEGNTTIEWGTIPKEQAESYEKTFKMLQEKYPLKNKPIDYLGDFRVIYGIDMNKDWYDLIDDPEFAKKWNGVAAQFMPKTTYHNKPYIAIVDPETSITDVESSVRELEIVRRKYPLQRKEERIYYLGTGTGGRLAHEYGHAIANDVGLYDDMKPLYDIFREFGKDEIEKQLSIYAATNPNEMFAEAFVQSFVPEYQSEISKRCMELVKSNRTVEKPGKSGIIKAIEVPKSLGAASKKYPVKLPDSRQHTKLSEGQTITGKTFAGKGTDTAIRERFKLESNYKIPADEWEKVSGVGYIVVNGKKRKAELHWYEANGEIVEMKVKRYLDED